MFSSKVTIWSNKPSRAVQKFLCTTDEVTRIDGTEANPDPIQILDFDDQKLEKIYSWKKCDIFLY